MHVIQTIYVIPMHVFSAKRSEFCYLFQPFVSCQFWSSQVAFKQNCFFKKGKRELSSVLIALILNISNPWLYNNILDVAFSFCFKLNCNFSETVAICLLHSSTQCTIPVFQGDLLIIVNLLMYLSLRGINRDCWDNAVVCAQQAYEEN